MARPSQRQLREQEENFMRSRLEAIPEIKKEIESKREIVNEQLAKELQRALDYLQEAEDFKLDGNNFNAHGSLEKAKPLARKTLLQSQALSILEMEDWHAGGNEQTDRVTSLWKAYIEPSFDLPAFLCVVHFENYIDGIFCIGTSEETVSTIGIRTRFLKNWTDILVQQSINLSDIKNYRPSLDGIGYEFQMNSSSLRIIQLQFGSPQTASLVEFERAFIKTAESIVSIEASQEGMSYVANIWKKYAQR
jgi:hypothetical protein